MTVHLTPAQAKRLGIDVGQGEPTATPPRPARRPRRKPIPQEWFCKDCGMRFTTEVDQDRHSAEVRHHRFEIVLDGHAER